MITDLAESQVRWHRRQPLERTCVAAVGKGSRGLAGDRQSRSSPTSPTVVLSGRDQLVTNVIPCLSPVSPCSFPARLSGTWVNSRTAQNVTVSGGIITNFFTCSSPPCTTNINSLECYLSDSSRYLLRSPITTVNGQAVFIYMCLQLTELTSEKYLYYQLHQTLNDTLKDYVVTFPFKANVTIEMACDDLSDAPQRGSRHHLFLKNGSETSSISTCPAGLLGEFINSNITCDSTYTTCNDDTQLKVTGTACTPKPFFSDSGRVGCLHSITANGTTYVTLYNSDPSPDGITTFTFTCVAFSVSGNIVQLSQNPFECVDSHSISTTNGVLFEYQKTGDCFSPCSFPAGLSGTWVNSRTAQEVTLTGGKITNFFTCSSPPCIRNITSLECYLSDSSRYLLRSPITTIDGQAVFIYMCLQLTELTSEKYLYYQLHQNLNSTLKDYVVTLPFEKSVTIDMACEDLSGVSKGSRHHLFLKNGNETSAYITCPEVLLGEFMNTDKKCQSMYDTCEDDALVNVTGSACSPKPFFSEGGIVRCLYTETVSDTTYITMFNTDANPDGTKTFRYVCVAAKLSGSSLQLSQNPLECMDSQTPSSIATTKGAVFTYDKTGDCGPETSEFDFMIIVIIVVVLVAIIIIIIIIVLLCIFCRKRRAAKRKKGDSEDVDVILNKEEDEDGRCDKKLAGVNEGGSNLSLDSGYPRSSTRGESRTGGRGGRQSQGFGTPRSHFLEVYEVSEEKDDKENHMISTHHHEKQRFEPQGKGEEDGDGETEELGTDEDLELEDSWEEFTDEDGIKQVRPKRRQKRQRRRKKVKQTYTRTHVLADGTTVEEEVESEYSVTDSSDVTSDEDRASLSDQIRAQKDKRRTRLQKVLEGPVNQKAAIVTREMDERAHQLEKETKGKRKRNNFLSRLRLRARERKSKTRVNQKRMKKGDGQQAEVMGLASMEREIPFLLQYQKKKNIERTLNDEGFFDDPQDKMTAETVFGFEASDRQLSPKPRHFGHRLGGEEERGERMVSATDSSQSEGSKSRDQESGANISEEEEEQVQDDDQRGRREDGAEKRVATKVKHVTIDNSSSSVTPSSDSGMRDEGSSRRKSSDTSSGVADLSPSHRTSSPVDGHPKQSRTISVGWGEKGRTLSRSRLSIHGKGPGGKDKEGSKEDHITASKAGKSKTKQDKRVKTALRRLLNERLFGIINKKSQHEGDSLTSADSIANNISEMSSIAGARGGVHRPFMQGKVAFVELDSSRSSEGTFQRSQASSQRYDDLSPVRRFRPHEQQQTEDDDSSNDKNKTRLPTRAGLQLPPLKTPHIPLDRVFTPANFPKWGLWITASQRAMLVDGLQIDRAFLTRMQARRAWGPKTDDMILPLNSRDTTKTEETTDDDNSLDPHRPVMEEDGEEEDGQRTTWAQRSAPPPGSNTSSNISYTKSSGRSSLDIDDRRLRRLLEELYKDKKFMDKLINHIESDHLDFPDHLAAEDVKFLSEFGRQYLLQRAQYWEIFGPLGPPRLPATALGMRLNRTQTSLTSDELHRSSNDTQDEVTSPRPKTVR